MAGEVSFRSFSLEYQRIPAPEHLEQINRLAGLMTTGFSPGDIVTLEHLKLEGSILVTVLVGERIFGMATLSARNTIVGKKIGTLDSLVIDPEVQRVEIKDLEEGNMDYLLRVLIEYIIQTFAVRMKIVRLEIASGQARVFRMGGLWDMGFKSPDSMFLRCSLDLPEIAKG